MPIREEGSNLNLLDLVEAELVASPVVELRRPGALVAGDLLSRLEVRIGLAEILEEGEGVRARERRAVGAAQAFHVHDRARVPIRLEPGRRAATLA